MNTHHHAGPHVHRNGHAREVIRWLVVLVALVVVVLVFLSLVTTNAQAQTPDGTFSIKWDAVSGVDGYRVFFGSASGSYADSRDTPPKPAGAPSTWTPPTELTITGLEDCVVHWVAVKAFRNGTDPNAPTLSASYSNELSGWPRPRVEVVTVGEFTAPGSYSTVIQGANFEPGATVFTNNTSVTVGTVVVTNCREIGLALNIAPISEPGGADLEVVNPDNVFGVLPGALVLVPQPVPNVTGATRGDTRP